MADVLPRIAGLKRAALDLLYPRWCIGCGREGDFFCRSCLETLPVISPPICPRCGRPLPDGSPCPDCPEGEDIDGIRAPFLFDGVVRRAIHELKYNNLRTLAPALAAMLNDYVSLNPLPGQALVPVPLHPRRLRQRGYNQSALLARELGRLSGLPVIEDCLVRREYSQPQVRSTGVEERRRNVAGAFACRDLRLAGRKILLIDDVATSGATLNGCAAAMKAGGAVEVWGLVVALEQ